MEYLLDFVLHIDVHLKALMDGYGIFIYVILFVIVFCETGLVFVPFLPGDSLLFACGALAATGSIDLLVIFVILAVAAILGDTVNYLIGKNLGQYLVEKLGGRIIKQKHLDKTHSFYEKYGGKTIFLARFVPIVRTFAPFVAGLGKMSYKKFGIYNIVGGIVWVSSFLLLGFYFGNMPFVKENFGLVIYAIILISVIPMVVEIIRGKLKKS